jgi:peptide/nickel transport system substrate-binding protein
MTNDGLVGFKHTGGGEGAELVPDLATSLPAPTDAGTAYTFQLRKGIRFSNGATLRASDVRATFERVFVARSRPRLFGGGSRRTDYFAGIVGADRCAKHRATCDLSRGISVDDRTGTVTFHLTKPDPLFLYKLALPVAFVVPADTPIPPALTRRAIARDTHAPFAPVKWRSVPATGPYYIQSVRGQVRLARNRRFREWSEAAKPDGYADVIEARLGGLSPQSDVERGWLDLINDQVAPEVTAFATQHPAQVHSTPRAATLFWYLDTRVPPFDDVRVRRAVSYALDRAKLVRIFGGPESVQATCQVLPPNFPGYRPYCPYTLEPTAGGMWTAPDLAKARALVRASGTAGAHVAFAVSSDEMARVARSVFEELGYRFSISTFEAYSVKHFGSFYPKPNAWSGEWTAPYPAAYNFFEPMMCAASGTVNPSRLCSPRLDREIRSALALQTRDRSAAAKMWSKIDRDATNLAGLVPLLTPRGVDLVSRRVGNYQRHPVFGVLLDQLWVK